MTNAISMLLTKLVENNPNVQNNPRAKEMIELIKSGDTEKGTQVAENLCKSYGMTKEEAITAAKNYFKL